LLAGLALSEHVTETPVRVFYSKHGKRLLIIGILWFLVAGLLLIIQRRIGIPIVPIILAVQGVMFIRRPVLAFYPYRVEYKIPFAAAKVLQYGEIQHASVEPPSWWAKLFGTTGFITIRATTGKQWKIATNMFSDEEYPQILPTIEQARAAVAASGGAGAGAMVPPTGPTISRG
jgi:hypothetical protein